MDDKHAKNWDELYKKYGIKSEERKKSRKSKTTLLLVVLVIIIAASVGIYYILPQEKQSQINEQQTNQALIAPSDIFYSDFPLPTPKKVVLVVGDTTYQTLKMEIDRFANDISSDLKTNVKILNKNYNSPAEVKDSLLKEKNNNGDFDGVIFIGDIPWQYIYMGYIDIEGGVSTFYRPSDAWLIDLENNSNYTEKTNPGCYPISLPECSVSKYIEINPPYKNIQRWSGRIMPPIGKSDRIELLKKYFDRNHEYKTGKLKYEGALIYSPDPTLHTCKTFDECLSNAKRSFVDTGMTTEDKLNIIIGVSSQKTKTAYLLNHQKNYKFEFINAHGTTTAFSTLKDSGESISYSDIVNNKPGALFYNFLSCNVGSFDVSDNLATAYVFEGNGLAAYASTVTIYVSDPLNNPNFENFLIGTGARLYEVYPSMHFLEILGDPTIRINEPPKSKCRLAFNQTNIDFGVINISEGITEENVRSGKGRLYLKIKNEGLDACNLKFVMTDTSVGIENLLAPLTLKPNEIYEFGIRIMIPEDLESNKKIASSALLRFISNDPQYIKTLPVLITLTS